MFPFPNPGPQIPEEVYDAIPPGMEEKSAEVLYQNAKADGYFDREYKLLEDGLRIIYDMGYEAGIWGRKIDLSNNVEIVDPNTLPQPQGYNSLSEAPWYFKAQFILRQYKDEIRSAAIAVGTITGSLYLLRKTLTG